MNILRHKKWHVRTKENVARVRRDEAKAAEEEKQRTERATIAENEDRVRRLKTRGTAQLAVASMSDIFGTGIADASLAKAEKFEVDPPVPSASTSATAHVNLFAELEEQERKNLTVGNKEYQAEKKKEQDDWESKVGIMKRFAEDTKEYAKETEWWQGIPLVRDKPAAETELVPKVVAQKFVTKEERKAKRRAEKEAKRREEKEAKRKRKKDKKKGKKRRRRSSSSSSADSSLERRRKKRLEQLRLERLARERQEQQRAQRLLKPVKEEPKPAEPKKTQVELDRERKYNTQFNPEFSKR